MAVLAQNRVLSGSARRSVVLAPSRHRWSTRLAAKRCVRVRAGLLEDIGKGIMSIFSLPTVDKTKPNLGAEGYQGSTRKTASRPFKDGYAGSSEAAAAIAADAESDESSKEAGYIDGAVQRLVSHNFTGDKETEPNWEGTGNGWTKDSRSRKSDGFHSITK